MQKVLTAEEMREVDRLTTEKYGIPSLILMENAAHAAARVIVEKLGGSVKGKSVLVLCGKGNNGGDGAALARILWTQGANCFVYLFGKIEDTKGEARINFEILKKIDESEETNAPNDNCLILFENFEFKTLSFIQPTDDLVVDAIFGTGLTRPIDEKLTKLFHFFSSQSKKWEKTPLFISIDIPSGLNSNLSDSIYGPFEADLTITFTTPKLANVLPPASNFNGKLVVANIGSPQELIDNSPSQLFITENEDAKDWLNTTKVQPNSYKKTRGTALIIAGSENYAGAAVLASNACFSAGAGMVSVAVPNSVKEIVATKTADEIIVKTLENTEILAEKVDVVAIGCGLANDSETHKFICQTVLNRQTPMVLDAEALNALAPFDLQGTDELPLILTPHLGEFKRLLGREVGENKIEEVREFSQKHNVILVLKGERSLIARPEGTVVINPTGNSGISRAGAGDTLTGIITSFIAQTLQTEHLQTKFELNAANLMDEIFKAVVAAVYIAGLAGDIAERKYGKRIMTATDVRNCLGEAIREIEKN